MLLYEITNYHLLTHIAISHLHSPARIRCHLNSIQVLLLLPLLSQQIHLPEYLLLSHWILPWILLQPIQLRPQSFPLSLYFYWSWRQFTNYLLTMEYLPLNWILILLLDNAIQEVFFKGTLNWVVGMVCTGAVNLLRLLILCFGSMFY